MGRLFSLLTLGCLVLLTQGPAVKKIKVGRRRIQKSLAIRCFAAVFVLGRGQSLRGHLKTGQLGTPKIRPVKEGRLTTVVTIAARYLRTGGSESPSGGKALNPRGLGTESPSNQRYIPMMTGGNWKDTLDRRWTGRILGVPNWPDWGVPQGPIWPFVPSEGSGRKKERPDTARGGWEYNQPIRKDKTEIPDERIGLPRDLICS